MSEERGREFESFDEPASNLPLLDKLDRVIASLPPGDPVRRDLLDLRPHVSDQSQMIGEARHMIEKLEEVIKKVTSPANRIGTFLGATCMNRSAYSDLFNEVSHSSMCSSPGCFSAT